MKKILLLTMLILGLSVQAWAYDFVEGGIYYTINDDGTVEVAYGGSSATAGTDTYTGDIVVPSTVTHEGTTYAVTGIGASAFRSNSELLSVYLPSSITYVAERAFQASSVITVTFEENANLVSFEGIYTFYGCESLESLTLPSNMQTIVTQMFRGCNSLEALEIPETVTSIEDRAFYGSGLKSIVIPDNVITLGTESTGTYGGVLRECTSLEEAVIGDAVTTIEYQLFRGDTSLKKVTFGKSCTEIGSQCFYDCSALEEIVMKCSVPPTAAYNSTSDGTFFRNVPETCVLYVPEGSKEAYEAANIWNTLTIVEVTEGAEDNSYVFVNTDWVYNSGRTSANDVVYNEDGTITVTASGDNNLSLGNTLDGGVTTTTSEKTVSSEQKWFTIIATNVVTDNDPDNWTSNPSFLWWLNGANYGTQVPATQVVTLSDGSVLVAWDVTLSGIDNNLKGDENYLNGWTCFGLTSTTGTSVISDINFYTDEELQEIIDSNTEPGIVEPEDVDSDYHTGDVIEAQDGKSYTVLGENLVQNHSFELGYEGWTSANDFTSEITSTYFKLVTAESDPDQVSGDQYLVGTGWGGSSSDRSLGTAWPIEEGKTYYFSYNIKNLSNAEETTYLKTSLTNNPGDETEELGYPASVSADWQTVEYVFDSKTYDYVQIKFRWLATEAGVEQWGFDNFQIYEVEAPEVEPEYVYETVYECEAEVDHWAIAGNTNGDFHLNTWSGETDASNMEVPFLEYWVGSWEGNLSAATVSHNTLSGLPAGDYEATLDIRIFSEAGNEITEGTTFAANGESVDLVATGTAGVYGTETEVYGTYTVGCEVGADGNLDISLVIPSGVTYNWISFKNLKVAKRTSTADIELVAVDGPMNAAVQAAMEDAIATFESTRTADSYYEAVAAIEAAEVSAAYYAPIVAAVDALDEDGAAVWAESNYATALADRTLTDEDVSADLAAAQKAQTAEGSDMTYVVLYDGDWTGNTGTYLTGVERYGDEIAVEDETVKVLYKTIEDLTPGTYEVTFYAVANNAWVGAAYGEGIAQVFANETTEAVTVYDQTGFSDLSVYSHTLTCTVDNDGVLEFGLQNVATGGNWYVAEAVSLTLVEAIEYDPYIYDVTYALNNPSFELDDIETLEYDETRDAYVVESPEGWTLTGEPGVSDIMTADATATDNNFGVPGEPSDGAQMLYLRNSWVDNKAVTLLQGLTLPAGDYKLTVDTKCVSNTGSTATLVAGDGSVALTIHDTENGSEATKENPFLDAWDTAVLTFTLTAETTLDLGVDIVFNGGNGSFLLDNFQLWSAEEVVITVDGNDNDYAVGDEVEIDGVTYAVVSDNMFVNGGFGDDVNDWTGSDYVTAADPDDFTLNATGGYNDGEYLTIASSSTGGGQGPGTTTTVNNLTQSIQIESGKTYLFVGYTTGGTTTGGGGPNQSTTTSGLNQMSDATTEVTQSSGGQGPGGQTTTAVAYVTLEWGSTTPGPQTSTTWTQTLAVFTAETPYAGMHLARSGSYDGFQLYEVEEVVEISDNEYAAGDVAEIDGIEYAVVSDNMVVNGGFDDGVDGWTAGDGTDNYVTAADPDNFTLETEGGFNDGAYITIPSTVGGYSSVSSPTQAIAVEEGKTYLFIGYTKGTAPTERNQAYNALVQMSDAYNEVVTSGHDAIIEVQLLWGAEPEETAEEWTKTEGVFTATTPYVGLRFSWCPNASFDGIQLYEVESAEVEPEPTPGEPVDWLAHSEEAVFEHWTTTGNNGTLQYNDWSTESDASGMTTPFIENWVNSSGDTPLTAATISHNTLVGLPAGDYTVSLDIRILNELEENVTTGTTFNANGVSVDLVQAGTSGTYDYDPEVYGTYTVECEVGDDGLLDISIEIPSNATYNWIAFKNLDVTIHADGTPVVTALEGLMAADAREAMEAAIEAYNANPSESLFTAAIDAIQDASQATEEYAEIMALVEALDEAGRAVWDETSSGIAYNNGTLSANADYTADMATAQKAQTTEGSDMTYVVLYEGTWIGQTGTYKTDYIERYDNDAAFTASDGKILYKQIDGLRPGTYTVTFLAVANSAWIGSAYGSNIAQVFVNEALEDVLVYNQVECIPTEYPHTMTGTVGSDGILEFGLQNIGTGGNWYVAQAVSMTLGGKATPSVSTGDYEFINEDWVSLDLSRVSQSDISYNIDDNTITVNAGTGKNNVALGNSLSYSADGTITTADYTVGNSQNWFIVVGTDLSTADGDSYLWWMNGDNKNSSVAPTYYVVMEDGQVLFAWDVTTSGLNDNLQESLNYLDGWTGFGLTSTSGTSVISDISFYTWDDAVAKYPDLTDIATGIKSVGVDVEAEGIYTLSGMRLSKITKSGIYIIDGKKVLVK